MASATVAAGFDVVPYVVVAWHDGLRVVAFGDIAVETDQPSLPMLSGTGSRTWVEHGMANVERAIVEVAGSEVDGVTDLGAGTVAAGGFRLELGRPATTATAPMPDAPAVDATQAVERSAPPPAAGPPPAEPPDPEIADEHHDPDVTLPPPASESLLAAVRLSDTDGRGSLVAAKLCANGHANPPTAATCAVCGDFLAPGTAAVVHVPRPSLGRLQLDDGELVDLDQELLIGRNPDRDEAPSRARMRRVKAARRQGVAQPPRGPLPGMGRARRRLRLDERHVRRRPSRRRRHAARAGSGPVGGAGRRRLLRLALDDGAGTRVNDVHLHVEFIGEERTIEPGDELTFGRQADLHIDGNRHLHRVLGRFWSRGDAWWLTNEGRSITIQIADADSRSSVQLAPGSEIALSFPNSILRFRAGITDYELSVRVPDTGADDEDDDDDPLDADDEDGGVTIALGDLMLTDEQRLLLLALAEGTLRSPHHSDELPTNRAVARRLGWSITKFNRKLDNLCERLTKLGVGGLRGSLDQLATDRRRRLVEHAIESGLIDRHQLDRLPPDIE